METNTNTYSSNYIYTYPTKQKVSAKLKKNGGAQVLIGEVVVADIPHEVMALCPDLLHTLIVKAAGEAWATTTNYTYTQPYVTYTTYPETPKIYCSDGNVQ
jgi:hypothetical protein